MNTLKQCAHSHGAQIRDIGLWVCGQCFSKLPERPKLYGLTDRTGHPQTIIWMAEIRVSNESTTLEDFLKAMARRYMKRARVNMVDAYDFALGFLRMYEEFGDPERDWSKDAAIELADEDMSYWDNDEKTGNK